MKKILITDSLFIFKEHEEKLTKAGVEFERLDKPNATEDELIDHLQDKDGYILGGIEKITDKIIKNAPKLKVISATVSDWKGFIPGWKVAEERGIAISNALGSNAHSVAEYSLAGILSLTRNLTGLGRCGSKTFEVTKSVKELTFGIIGLGRIGEILAKMLKDIGAENIIYYSKNRKENLENDIGIKYVSLEELLQKSDVISQHVPSSEGTHIKSNEFNKMKYGAIIINNGSHCYIDKDALYENLKKGKIKAFQDSHIDEERFKELSKEIWMNSNMSTAFNTNYANKLASDIVTNSMINLLNKKDDEYKVN